MAMMPVVLTDRGVELDPGKLGAVTSPAPASVGSRPDPAPSAPTWFRRDGFSVFVIAVYLGLGVTAYWPVLSDASGRLVSQVYGDPSQMVWFFGWTAHALATGHNPFFSSAANAPYGLNLAQMTSAPLLGVLCAPLTLLAGPVASVTVCFVLAMPASAAAAYAVLRRWKIWAPAAALGGLAFGFSPYMVNEGNQHLNLVFLPLVPLIVATLVELFNRPRHPLRWGAALGGLAAAQYFISSEMLALTALMSVFGLTICGAYWALTKPGELRTAVGPAIRGVAIAVGVSLVLLAYPIWFGFAGPHHYTGPAWPEALAYDAHLSDFVAPTPLQLVRPVMGATGASLYRNSYLLEGAYLGWAVLAVVALLLWVCRRSPRVRLAGALGAVAALLSFGSHAEVNGKSVALPFLVLTKVPTLGDIIPVRFSVATAACIAAVLAFALDSIHRGDVLRPEPVDRWKSRRANAAFAAVFVVVGVTWLPAWPFTSQSVQRLPSTVVKALPAGDPLVLTYPYPLTADDNAMLWQAEAAFPFRLLGVYAMVPQRDGRPAAQAPLLRPDAVQEYFAAEETGSISSYPKPSPNVDMVAQVREFVVRYHVDAVLVNLSATNAARVEELFSSALGPPRLTNGGFDLWVTGRSRPDVGRPGE
jgi:hypothetical protein